MRSDLWRSLARVDTKRGGLRYLGGNGPHSENPQRSNMAYSRSKYTPKRYSRPKSRRAASGTRKRGRVGGAKARVPRAVMDLVKAAAAAKKALKQNFSVKALDMQVPFFVGTKDVREVRERYFSVLVTLSLPLMAIAPFVSEVYRRTRKVFITGFTMEFEVSHVHAFQLSAYCITSAGHTLSAWHLSSHGTL
jgi:hypothetical protein